MLPNVEQPFEVLPRGEPMDPLWRGFAKVPKEDFVAVRIEAEGQFAVMLRLDVVAILLGLLASEFSVLGSLLGFDDRQRLAVLAQENVVAKSSGARRVWRLARERTCHTPPLIAGRHEELFDHLRPISHVPPRLFETEVDDLLSCRGLRRHFPRFRTTSRAL